MKYLNIIVVSFLATLCCFFPDCDGSEKRDDIVEFAFANNSGYDIDIVSESKEGSSKNTIKNNEVKKEKIIDLNLGVSNDEEVFNIIKLPPFIGLFSIIIKFNNEKCLIFSNRRYKNKEYITDDADNCVKKRSLYCYDNNYVVAKVENNHYLCTYILQKKIIKRQCPVRT